MISGLSLPILARRPPSPCPSLVPFDGITERPGCLFGTPHAGLVALEAELSWFEEQMGLRGLILVAARHPTTETYRQELERLLAEPFEVAITALWAMELPYLEGWRGAAPSASKYREFVEHWTAPLFASYVADLEVHATDSPAAEAAWLRIVSLEREFWDIGLSSR